MATLVLTNATALYGSSWTGTAPGPGNPTVSGTIASSTDFTDHCYQVQLGNKIAMQDFTTFGDGAFMTQKPGLKSSQLQISFRQDYAASSVDAVYGAAFFNGTLVYQDIKPTGSARAATNPSYVYAGYVSNYDPIGVQIGNALIVVVTIDVTGTYTRLTS